MGVIQQRVVTYPELSTLFDSAWIKSMHTRRVLQPAGTWRPKIHGTEYDQHQFWGLGCAIRHEGFIIAADTGMGKTKIAIDAIDYWMMVKGAKHALVITGNPTSTYEWMEQGEQYGRFAVTDVRGTTNERRAALMHFPETPILATDYKTLQHTFAAKQKVGKSKSKFVPDVEKLVAWGRMFDIIVLDELHHVKNPQTLCHQIIAALVTEIKYRLGLTGTPFDRHPEHAWGQFHVIDRDATFGTYHDFLGYFFEAKQSFWSMYQVDYKLRKDRKGDFRRRVRHRLIRITKAEAPNMPDVQRAIVNLKPSPGTWPLMEAAKQRVKDARKDKEQHSEFAYLRQLCSGLIRTVGEDERFTVRAESCTKIDWLLAKLEELPKEEQLVVFYEFRQSGMWVNEALTAAKEKVSWLYGGMGGNEMVVLEAWRKKRTRVLLTQTQKAAESLNLQQAAYLVQYESPVTYAQEKQSLARVGGRIGGRSSIVYTLTVKNSQELKILELIREGRNTMQELLE